MPCANPAKCPLEGMFRPQGFVEGPTPGTPTIEIVRMFRLGSVQQDLTRI